MFDGSKRLLVFFGVFIISHLILAQKSTNITFEDNIKKALLTKPQLDVKFDSRFSFIASRDIKTTGVKIGVSFNRKLKMGLGYNQQIIPLPSIIKQENDIVNAVLKYVYLSPYLEYVYHNTKRWEFSLTTQIGLGQGHYQYRNEKDGKLLRARYSAILSYEPAMLIDYKIIRWVGIGTGVGYRLIFYKNSNIEETMSSPVYVVKLKIYLGEIVRTISGKQIQEE